MKGRLNLTRVTSQWRDEYIYTYISHPFCFARGTGLFDPSPFEYLCIFQKKNAHIFFWTFAESRVGLSHALSSKIGGGYPMLWTFEGGEWWNTTGILGFSEFSQPRRLKSAEPKALSAALSSAVVDLAPQQRIGSCPMMESFFTSWNIEMRKDNI